MQSFASNRNWLYSRNAHDSNRERQSRDDLRLGLRSAVPLRRNENLTGVTMSQALVDYPSDTNRMTKLASPGDNLNGSAAALNA